MKRSAIPQFEQILDESGFSIVILITSHLVGECRSAMLS